MKQGFDAAAEWSGKYELLAKLKEGGMGAVYKVRHRLLDELRVVKVLRPHLANVEEIKKRFHQEARIAIQLRYPNIAQLYDFSIDTDGTAYLVMEFIDGVSLREALDALGRPSVDFSVRVARQCLRALSYLHRQGFIHRDVSPDNFMLTRDFEGEALIKVIDLGIAKETTNEVHKTADGMFLGKILYSAPEQLSRRPGQELDSRCDLYGFGVMLYELLTGKLPVRGDNFAEIAVAHLVHPPVPFSEADPEGRVPEGLRAIVARMLEKDPAARPATAEEVEEALSGYQAGSDAAAEFDELLEGAHRFAAETGQRAKPGSTQSRLDLQFGIDEVSGAMKTVRWSGTDGPSPQPGPQPVPAADTDGTDSQRDADVTGESARGGRGDEAAAEDEARQRREALSQPLDQIAEQIEDGSFEEAKEHLLQARTTFGESPRVKQLERKLEKEREESQRRTRSREHFERGEGLYVKGLHTEAAAELKAALALDRSYSPAKTLLTKIERELARMERGRKRELSVRREIARTERLLAAGHWRAADLWLRLARRRFGEDDQWTDVAVRCDEARRRHQRTKCEELVSRSEAEEAAGRHSQAARALRRALELNAVASDEDAPPRSDDLGRRLVELEKKAAHAGQVQVDPRLLKAGGVALALLVLVAVTIWTLVRDDGRATGPAAGSTAVAEPDEGDARTEPPLAALSSSPLPTASESTLPLEALPAGLLALEAKPWAEIQEILDAHGQPTKFDRSQQFTPAFLELAPGTYMLLLAHPTLLQPVRVEVSIEDGVLLRETVEITALTGREYLARLGWRPPGARDEEP